MQKHNLRVGRNGTVKLETNECLLFVKEPTPLGSQSMTAKRIVKYCEWLKAFWSGSEWPKNFIGELLMIKHEFPGKMLRKDARNYSAGFG